MQFDHERLDVYRVARSFNRWLSAFLEGLDTRGRRDFVTQATRSAASITLNIAEGSGEYSPKEKARFYRMARRSAAECAASLDNLVDYGIADEARVENGKALLRRIVTMLIRLIVALEDR